MAPARLLLAVLALIVCATAATSAPAAPAAPTGLHGFLFRADEPTRREFPRTPSFAWAPVPGAVRYEFELSLSDTFRENGILFVDRNLKTPVASVQLTLPWITGSPYSLFARVRAVTSGGAGAWSAPFGFNMRQPNVPKPLPTFPGLLRWTPVEGADAYEVWLIDVDKKLFVYTNVLDQREFYTFHQADPWISKVRWRIRAHRWDVRPDATEGRLNGVPATRFGPWSPVYESSNASFDTGPLRLVATVSDVVARGQSTEAAHRFMPAFVFAGNKGLDGKEAELFRVYAFTDRDCVNRVFTGSIVGSPAFAGRPYGTLALPRNTATLFSARSGYLNDGDAGPSFAQDGEDIVPNEELESPKPTLGLPGGTAPAATPAPPTTPPSDDSSTTPAAPAAPTTSGTVNFLTVEGDMGAPVDLWDIDWPQGGYYWTVVPVQAVAPASIATSVQNPAAIGDTAITVSSGSGFATGDVIQVGNPSNQEAATVTGVSGDVLTVATALKQGHGAGEPVVRTSGNLTYRDLELPQEVCAAGRVMRFGKSSEPTLVSAGTPFVSGLSPRGRLTSATTASASFYGSPLVAWTPALGADAYHVQWSKKRAPFTPVDVTWKDKGTAAGFLTFATSAVLPLQPGTWWYRVRGVEFNLPTSAQWLGWSEPTRLVVTKPTFVVSAPKAKKKK